MKLNLRCPTKCNGHIQPVEVGSVATEVADRTCRRCGARWRLVIAPLPLRHKGAEAHKVEWICLRGARSLLAKISAV